MYQFIYQFVTPGSALIQEPRGIIALYFRFEFIHQDWK